MPLLVAVLVVVHVPVLLLLLLLLLMFVAVLLLLTLLAPLTWLLPGSGTSRATPCRAAALCSTWTPISRSGHVWATRMS